MFRYYSLQVFLMSMATSGKGKVSILAKWPDHAGAYPNLCSIKRLGVFLLPPPLDGMLVHSKVTPALWSPVPIYTPGWRETLSLAQEHNTMSPTKAGTRTT